MIRGIGIRLWGLCLGFGLGDGASLALALACDPARIVIAYVDRRGVVKVWTWR